MEMTQFGSDIAPIFENIGVIFSNIRVIFANNASIFRQIGSFVGFGRYAAHSHKNRLPLTRVVWSRSRSRVFGQFWRSRSRLFFGPGPGPGPGYILVPVPVDFESVQIHFQTRFCCIFVKKSALRADLWLIQSFLLALYYFLPKFGSFFQIFSGPGPGFLVPVPVIFWSRSR